MQINVTENIMVVVTDISKEAFEKNVVKPVVEDKTGEIYRVGIGEVGKMGPNYFTANTVVDGKLAATIVGPMDSSTQWFKTHYGKAVVAAAKYTLMIAMAIDEANAEIENAFAAVEA